MNATLETLDQVTLYYCQGSSDKVYQAAIAPSGGGFVVTFAYGRRGATLATGTKTSLPVTYETAKTIFTRLVGEKKAKGYTEGADGMPYQHAEKKISGLLPQLLNPIEAGAVLELASDDVWGAQEKFDGRRLLLRKHGADVEGINRKGLVIGLPKNLGQAIQQHGGECVLDGESVGDVYHAFDVLELDGVDMRSRPYWERLAALQNLLSGLRQKVIRLAKTALHHRTKAGVAGPAPPGREGRLRAHDCECRS
jgi:bifunctional non-homologous end joining protein LigD